MVQKIENREKTGFESVYVGNFTAEEVFKILWT